MKSTYTSNEIGIKQVCHILQLHEKVTILISCSVCKNTKKTNQTCITPYMCFPLKMHGVLSKALFAKCRSQIFKNMKNKEKSNHVVEVADRKEYAEISEQNESNLKKTLIKNNNHSTPKTIGPMWLIILQLQTNLSERPQFLPLPWWFQRKATVQHDLHQIMRDPRWQAGSMFWRIVYCVNNTTL